jgi:uncharacterized protein (DUF58 family)
VSDPERAGRARRFDPRRFRTSLRAFRLTRRGTGFLVAAAVVFVAAPAFSAPALLNGTGLLLGLVLLGLVFVAAGHSRVRVDRSFSPQIVDPGQSVRARLVVSNTSSVPCAESVWSDRLPAVVAGEAAGVLPGLGPAGTPDATTAASYTIASSTRGVHRVGPLRVRVVDPFGLVERQRDAGQPHEITVLPRRYDLPPLGPSGSDDDGATRPAPHQMGLGEDDIIARSYQRGDALKRLHWKATARRGELMVRQEEQQMNPRAAVLIDLDADSHGTARDRGGTWEFSPGLEWAVAAGASIITHLSEAGYSVSVASPCGQLDVELADGRDSLRQALVALARCEPSDTDTWRIPVERATFVVAGRLEPDRARRWVQALGEARSVSALIGAGSRTGAFEVTARARWRRATWTPQSDIPGTWAELDGSRVDAAR